MHQQKISQNDLPQLGLPLVRLLLSAVLRLVLLKNPSALEQGRQVHRYQFQVVYKKSSQVEKTYLRTVECHINIQINTVKVEEGYQLICIKITKKPQLSCIKIPISALGPLPYHKKTEVAAILGTYRKGNGLSLAQLRRVPGKHSNPTINIVIHQNKRRRIEGHK